VDAAVSTDTFGWRVLQTLADRVEAIRQDSVDGTGSGGPTVGIRLDKHAGAPPR
jgi:serine/threonine-protein kinase RsbW